MDSSILESLSFPFSLPVGDQSGSLNIVGGRGGEEGGLQWVRHGDLELAARPEDTARERGWRRRRKGESWV